MPSRRTTLALIAAATATVGLAAPAAAGAIDPRQHQPSSWEQPGTTCTKVELGDGVASFTPQVDDGQALALVVLKAGAQLTVFLPEPGVQRVFTPGNGKDVSFAITCVASADAS